MNSKDVTNPIAGRLCERDGCYWRNDFDLLRAQVGALRLALLDIEAYTRRGPSSDDLGVLRIMASVALARTKEEVDAIHAHSATIAPLAGRKGGKPCP